jgi:hypothetical protein
MELHDNLKFSRAISPAAATTDNTAWVSQILDTANYSQNELAILTGSLADADATFTVLMEESDASDMTGAASVADADLLGTESAAGFTFADDNSTKKIGYKGSKRYIRATITPANNTGNAFVCAIWVQGGARVAPIA